MIMPPRLRTFALTAHVTSSVGWIGAVVVFLALAVIGLTSPDAQTVRGAYLVMEPAARLVLLPLAVASLLTGFVMSLGTTWGLFRHYWVVFKLVINVFATVILLMYMATFRHMAGMAGNPSVNLSAVRNASPRFHAAVALLLLLTATVLAVYKPRGMTPYGRRKLHRRSSLERRSESRAVSSYAVPRGDTGDGTSTEPDRTSSTTIRWPLYVLFGMVALFMLVVILHIAGGGHGHH
jgi:hypothetical protein